MKISEIPLLFLSQIMLYMTCNSNTFRHIESKYKKKKKKRARKNNLHVYNTMYIKY